MVYEINYDDKRFQQVESDRNAALTENEQLYGGMVSEAEKYYQAQIDASKDWAEEQKKYQQEQTDFAIEKIEQQKDQTKKDYTREQSGAYVDWQKESNRYGANAEQIASAGLAGSGYSESSQVSIYNAYQNRVASARESYNAAVLNYNNAIKDARLQNNSKMAEIAYQALQAQLELSLQGFQYKNQLLMQMADQKVQIGTRYDSKYQAVLDQMNRENALQEEIRQYNANLAEEQRQYNTSLEEEQRQYNANREMEINKYNWTMTALEKGYIDTDTIESVIGGDTYNSYKTIQERESALRDRYNASKEELETLRDMPNKEMSDRQQSRMEELKKTVPEMKKKLDNFDADNQKSKVRDQLRSEMLGIVDGTKLAESYHEKTRRSQLFEVDITKYDSKQQEVIKRAVDSGILNNTNRTHEFVDMIAKISADKGVLFDFTNNAKLKDSAFAVDGKIVNGFVDQNGNVALNIDSAKALNSVVGHEITHVLEGTEFYNELRDAVRRYANTRGDYASRVKELIKTYEGMDADIEMEVTADLIGDYLFTDSDFVSNLSTEQPGLFQKIFDEIKYLFKVATTGSKEKRELEKVKRAFEKAYRESATVKSDGTVKNSLSDIANMSEKSYNHHGWAKVNDVLSKQELADFQSKVGTKERDQNWHYPLPYGKHMFEVGDDGVNSTLIISDGNFNSPSIDRVYKIDLDNETDIEYVRDLVYESEKAGKWSLQGSAIEELKQIQLVKEYTRKDFQQFSELSREYDGIKGKRNYRFDSELQDGIGSIGETGTKQSVNEKVSSNDDAFFDAKYSLSDSDGRQLSRGQQEYFADSKVRDDNGNLKVMYHGTPNGSFTVFRDGTYFTDNKEYADKYQRPYASSISTKKSADNPRTYEVYLNITKPLTETETELNQSISDIQEDIKNVYPVGSIHININGTNPSTLFGGTWEQVSQAYLVMGRETSSGKPAELEYFDKCFVFKRIS